MPSIAIVCMELPMAATHHMKDYIIEIHRNTGDGYVRVSDKRAEAEAISAWQSIFNATGETTDCIAIGATIAVFNRRAA